MSAPRQQPATDEERLILTLSGQDGVGSEERARALLGHLAFYGYQVVRIPRPPAGRRLLVTPAVDEQCRPEGHGGRCPSCGGHHG